MANDVYADSAGGAALPAHGGFARALAAGARLTEGAVGWCCRGVLLVTGLAMLAILTVMVVLRYTYAGSLDYGSELTSLIFPVFVMAGIVEAARQGAHIATQVLPHFLNEAWRTRLAILIHAVSAVLYLYLAWFALQNAIIAHDEQSTILRVPGSLGYGCLAAGLALVGACSLAALVRYTAGREKMVLNLAEPGPGVV